MTTKNYTRLQLAADQLYAAVCLFITGRDRFSVITLAGRDEDWVMAFFLWVKENIDPNKYNVSCDPNWKSPT
jgi:hypothetical protein